MTPEATPTPGERQHGRPAPTMPDPAIALRKMVEEGLAEIEAALASSWGDEQGNTAKQPARAAVAKLRAKLAS